MRRFARGLLPLLFALPAACSYRELMATPRIYQNAEADPFAAVPAALRTPEVGLIYVTDRARTEAEGEPLRYGIARSRTAAFGTLAVRLGDNTTWESLVAASREKDRTERLRVSVADVRELGRWPETPYPLQVKDGRVDLHPKIVADRRAAMSAFQALVKEKLRTAPRKEALVFIHGYNNTFEDPAEVLGMLSHFLGREFVPILYSWPAGAGGLLRGYTEDRESGEFTIFHLKEMLRALADCEGLERVHLLAHSRGTDVLTTALRELHLELGRKVNERDPKLATLILAAPDLDPQVISQRLGAEGLVHAPGRTVIYISSTDRALGISAWLFRSVARLGGIQTEEIPADVVENIRRVPTLQVIDAQVTGFGSWGHDYFYSHPAVSSDLILLLRRGLDPGPERPLVLDPNACWILKDDYPFPKKP